MRQPVMFFLYGKEKHKPKGKKMATITLGVVNVTTNITSRPTFHGPNAEAHAVAYIDRKSSTCAFFEVEETEIDLSLPLLLDKLYPSCEHGLSLSLCAGPQHYPYDFD